MEGERVGEFTETGKGVGDGELIYLPLMGNDDPHYRCLLHLNKKKTEG